MHKPLKLLRRISLLLLPVYLMAADNTVIVADSRQLSGLRAWWANLYNDSHLDFALLTIIFIPLAGTILGSLADVIMKRVGIDLKSRALREG